MLVVSYMPIYLRCIYRARASSQRVLVVPVSAVVVVVCRVHVCARMRRRRVVALRSRRTARVLNFITHSHAACGRRCAQELVDDSSCVVFVCGGIGVIINVCDSQSNDRLNCARTHTCASIAVVDLSMFNNRRIRRWSSLRCRCVYIIISICE